MTAARRLRAFLNAYPKNSNIDPEQIYSFHSIDGKHTLAWSDLDEVVAEAERAEWDGTDGALR